MHVFFDAVRTLKQSRQAITMHSFFSHFRRPFAHIPYRILIGGQHTGTLTHLSTVRTIKYKCVGFDEGAFWYMFKWSIHPQLLRIVFLIFKEFVPLQASLIQYWYTLEWFNNNHKWKIRFCLINAYKIWLFEILLITIKITKENKTKNKTKHKEKINKYFRSGIQPSAQPKCCMF